MNTHGSPSQNALSLAGKTIGISISDSEDLEALGMNKAVLDLAYVEVARHLLAHGARLAYGGDQRQAGYTQQLYDLVRAYEQPMADIYKRVVNYLAWPIHVKLTDKDRTELMDVVTLERLPLEATLREEFGLDESAFVAPNTTENRYVWARCLTAMRKKMNHDIDARIVLGGQSSKFSGRYPGIAEEALLAASSDDSRGKPIFLLGGFGGCTADLVKAIEGNQPKRLTLNFQFNQSKHTADYRELYAFYNQRHTQEPLDYDALLAPFRTRGIDALNNALGPDENTRLFQTDDIDEIIALILKGLR